VPKTSGYRIRGEILDSDNYPQINLTFMGPCIVNVLSSIPTRCNVIQYSLLLSGIGQACLLLPLALAASKLDLYQMLCVQF